MIHENEHLYLKTPVEKCKDYVEPWYTSLTKHLLKLTILPRVLTCTCDYDHLLVCAYILVYDIDIPK